VTVICIVVIILSQCFKCSLIFIITIPRAATQFQDVGIFKSATEDFGMLLDDCFAVDGFLGS